MDERGVTFKWKDYRVKEGAKGGPNDKTRHKTMTLAPEEFMRCRRPRNGVQMTPQAHRWLLLSAGAAGGR